MNSENRQQGLNLLIEGMHPVDRSMFKEVLISLQGLVDKEKPMKPLRTSGGSYICPNCVKHHFRKVSKDMRYCSWCGQKLQWRNDKND